MWQNTLKYEFWEFMQYSDFLAELKKAGLSVAAFAKLIGMNPNSVSNYSKAGTVPDHLAMIAVLIRGIYTLGGDYRAIMSTVPRTPKKPRGSAQKGRFGADRQIRLDIDP